VIDIALVVVTFNSAGHLDRLLDSLDAALGGLRAALVFVDNDSQDDTVARLRARREVEVLALPVNRGYAAAINVGLARTREAPAVLVLNPDLELGPGSVPALLAASREPGVGIVVPQLRTPDGDLYPSLRREPTVARALGAAVMGGQLAGRFPRLSEAVSDDRQYCERRDVDWATGAAMLLSRGCVDATGPWDESYFLYSEETEFHLRAGALGFGVRYVADASAVHLEGDSGTSPRLWALLTANRLRLFARLSSRPRTAAYWVALVLRESSRAARGDAIARAAVRVLVRPDLLRAPRGPAWLDLATPNPVLRPDAARAGAARP
jgi:GT2 family glycosyltransferase